MAAKTPKTTTKSKGKAASTPRRTSSNAPKAYKSNKPLFSAGTIVTLVTFLLVIAVAIYVGKKKETEAASATPVGGETTYVFTDADGAPTSIKVEPENGEAVQIELNEQKTWVLTLPEKTEANQSMAEAAATQVKAISIVPPEIKGEPADFGLDTPTYVISVKFDSGQNHQLEVGDAAISGNGYYARLDKGAIMLVSVSGIDALTQLAFSPPYLNTPTPTALPATETPVPVLDTPTPAAAELTVTPTP
jgi:hypothetical protein